MTRYTGVDEPADRIAPYDAFDPNEPQGRVARREGRVTMPAAPRYHALDGLRAAMMFLGGVPDSRDADHPGTGASFDATQTLWQKKSKNMLVRVAGELGENGTAGVDRGRGKTRLQVTAIQPLRGQASRSVCALRPPAHRSVVKYLSGALRRRRLRSQRPRRARTERHSRVNHLGA
jgi:hypothetical protein